MLLLFAPRLLPCLGLLLLLPVGAARGQPDTPEIDLNLLALQWTRGSWRAPLVCSFEGAPHRGLRRVLVAPGPRDARPPSFRLQLFDLEVPVGTRCTDETGRPQPNAQGTVYFHLEAISRPDIARRDFDTLLRREGGFEFRIRRGRLRLADAVLEDGASGYRQVDFRGGKARFGVVKRGSDAYRRLAGFGERRKLTLGLEAPDGYRLDLDLVHWELR